MTEHPIATDREKTAIIGGVFSLVGLGLLRYGLDVLLAAGRTTVGILLLAMGFTLTLSSLLFFVGPALYDYVREARGEETQWE